MSRCLNFKTPFFCMMLKIKTYLDFYWTFIPFLTSFKMEIVAFTLNLCIFCTSRNRARRS